MGAAASAALVADVARCWLSQPLEAYATSVTPRMTASAAPTATAQTVHVTGKKAGDRGAIAAAPNGLPKRINYRSSSMEISKNQVVEQL